jgi:hypothetical protein
MRLRRRLYSTKNFPARLWRTDTESSDDFAQRYPANMASAVSASVSAASETAQDLLNCVDDFGGRVRYPTQAHRDVVSGLEPVRGIFARQASTTRSNIGGLSGWMALIGSGLFSRIEVNTLS